MSVRKLLLTTKESLGNAWIGTARAARIGETKHFFPSVHYGCRNHSADGAAAPRSSCSRVETSEKEPHTIPLLNQTVASCDRKRYTHRETPSIGLWSYTGSFRRFPRIILRLASDVWSAAKVFVSYCVRIRHDAVPQKSSCQPISKNCMTLEGGLSFTSQGSRTRLALSVVQLGQKRHV